MQDPIQELSPPADNATESSDGFQSDDFDEILFLDSTPEHSDYVHETDSDDNEDSRSAPRIKFKVSLPDATVTHPGHIVHPSFDSLDDYLNSFVSLDDDISKEECQAYVEDQAELRNRIAELKQSGMYDLYLKYMQEMNYHNLGSASSIPVNKPFSAALISSLRKPCEDPLFQKNVATFQDHLVTQAVFFSKLMADERRVHVSRSKKMAGMVDLYFKRLSNAEEKGRKLEEKRVRQLARKTAYEVMKKWKIAEKVVQHRRAKLLEDEQRQAGKKQLNRILEQSAQLLEARVTTTETAKPTSRSGTFNDDDDTSYFGSGGEEEEESDKESEKEPEKKQHSNGTSQLDIPDPDIPDSQLTVEELKQKYAVLPDLDLDPDLAYSDSETKLSSDSDHSTVMDSEDESDSFSDDSEGPGLAALLQPVTNDDASCADEKEVSKPSARASRSVSAASPAPGTEVVKTAVPFLLRGSLREYQHFGLDWLAGLYNNNTNGILADEMGLGKTIQTIALISYLACEKQVWGPHLIVVPTSVMLNWEMEFKRFAPGFKVLTYYGNPVQRKQKRQGWNKEDTWHVCITSYQLVIQDQNAFKRKKWHYMILDEAHNIKNFRSQRWQSLLNFNTQHRLLLTGTPLQNNLMELWSLLYFLMPSGRASQAMPEGFADLQNFQEWFSRPVEKMVEGGGVFADKEAKETISKLHQILRPYLLRRLKADVEKQMPAKYEHVVYCKLSKRQRFLYDDFMSRAQTRETLASGNFLSIINCLMQLRKVCNHPDLFEVRPIVTSLAVEKSVAADFEIKDFLVRKRLVGTVSECWLNSVNLDFVNLKFTHNDMSVSRNESISTRRWGDSRKPLIQEILGEQEAQVRKAAAADTRRDLSSINGHLQYVNLLEKQDELIKLESTIYQSHYKCERAPMYGTDLIKKLSTMASEPAPARSYDWDHSTVISSMTLGYEQREAAVAEIIDRYAFVTPKVVCLDLPERVLGPEVSQLLGTVSAPEPVDALDEMSKLELAVAQPQCKDNMLRRVQSQSLFHRALVKLSLAFPDKRLLQFDCGKLQRLADLLHDLIPNGHRALIFTQMTRVLDILEQFLNLHGYRYLRLDGATRIEQRQVLTERFNQDSKIPIFILSTRSGGLGINLTGADTVIFYDSDWNPSMDKQCQDRCHRIGQTRDVHIYRLVSEYTIESNILRKAQQKQLLDSVVIQEGEFTTDYFTKLTVRDMLGDDSIGGHAGQTVFGNGPVQKLERVLAEAEDDMDARAAKVAMREVTNLDAEDFGDKAEEEAEEEEEEEEGISSVDDYMIRFIEGGYFWD